MIISYKKIFNRTYDDIVQDNSSGNSTSKYLYIFLDILLVALLCGITVYRSLPTLAAPFQQPEYLYYHSFLAAQSVKDILQFLGAQMQPVFEYAMRKVLWVPLLGYSERALRIPSLVSVLSILGFVYFLIVYAVPRLNSRDSRWERHPLRLRFGAFCFAALLLQSGLCVSLISAARHYAFAALVSLVWLWQLLKVLEYSVDVSSKSFLWLLLWSFVFLNTHFFAFPMVGAGVAILVLSSWFRGDWLQGLFKGLVGSALAAISIYINSDAFDVISRFKSAPRPIAVALADGIGVVNSYWASVAVPRLFFAILFIGLAMQFYRAWSRTLMFFATVLVPALLLWSRYRSDYTFDTRYLAPYFGVILLIYAIGLGQMLRRSVVGFLVSIGLFVLVLQTSPLAQLRAQATPRFGPYFTNVYKVYRELRETKRPLFIVDVEYDCMERGHYYMRFAGNDPYKMGYEVVDLGYLETKVFLDKFFTFIKMHPNALVVLEKYNGVCRLPEWPRHFNVTRPDGRQLVFNKTQQGDECYWMVDGIKTFEDLAAAMNRVGHVGGEGIFERYRAFLKSSHN